MVIAKYYTTFVCLCLLCGKALSTSGKECNASDITLQQCSNEWELCNSATNKCECVSGYIFVDSQCTAITTPGYDGLIDNEGNGSLLAGIFIPMFLILIVISSIYLGKKYEVLKWVRNKINQRNNNYDEFMIGQDLDDDDPPLA